MDLEILHDRDAIWYNLLSFKYGEVHKFFCAEYIVTNRTNSVWWRDLVKIGIGSGALTGWLNGVVRKKLGNGHNTSFWHDKWIGVIPLKNVYPRLFSVSVDKDSSVAESGRLDLDGDRWIWHWCWRRQLFNWEEALADELKDTLDGVGPTKEGNDKWVWNSIESVEDRRSDEGSGYGLEVTSRELSPLAIYSSLALFLVIYGDLSVLGWEFKMCIIHTEGVQHFLMHGSVVVGRAGRKTGLAYSDWSNCPIICLSGS
ncbi:receptor-like kinase [Trifolium pratense]|uniref:Receptor-like kinase n=1 Tax=Trifolium pratense TaxID=57577 RepID=A0A2K3P747_TRIPR|nr:receptor-like kinase [Trifolium pratense]